MTDEMRRLKQDQLDYLKHMQQSQFPAPNYHFCSTCGYGHQATIPVPMQVPFAEAIARLEKELNEG